MLFMSRVVFVFTLLCCLTACSGSSSESSSEPSPIDPSPPEPEQNSHQDSKGWALIDVDAQGPYGERVFTVPAAQNWVNTGVYLREGEKAQIRATGTWRVISAIDQEHGPEGLEGSNERGCQSGQLVARIGLYYEDSKLTCIGSEGEITAHRAGILFVGGLVGNDLGETYESRRNARGSLTVTVASQSDTVPTVSAEMAGYYSYDQVRSGWVELRGDYTILTLPTATASQDKNRLQAVLKRFDDVYRNHQVLRGAQPQHGQPIRWFPDDSAPGWMLAGNPVRMDLALVGAQSSSRLTLATESSNGNWGFLHELGHDFNFINGDWQYAHSTLGIEAWPNIFSVYAQEQLNLPLRELNCPTKKAFYQATGRFSDLTNDVWLGLCFLLEFKDLYGWGFYQRFHTELNQSAFTGWEALYARFERAAGESVRPIFDAWKIPLAPSSPGEPEP